MIYFILFVFGSLVGSFLNVCIMRLPKGESIIFPRSHCPKCKKSIYWYDNIPLLSYIFLKGRCRFCRERFSFRYFIVELVTAAFFVILYERFGLSLDFLIYIFLSAILIVVSFIDLELQIILDNITTLGIIVGLVSSFLPGHPSFFDALLGVLAGGGSIYLLRVIGNLVFKKESMGGGDIKLLAMIGAFIGWKLVLLTFFLAPLSGSIVGIALKIKRKAEIIPYGPHLALGAFISILWGERILNWLFLI